jgi:hypothetical protein
MSAQPGRRYCGRDFSAADLAHIRELLQLQPVLGRVALSRRVCQDLGWLNALGQPKEMSCRVALLRMEKDGLIQLPRTLEPEWPWPTSLPTDGGFRPPSARAPSPPSAGAAGL